jgi:Transcription factor WhiB
VTIVTCSNRFAEDDASDGVAGIVVRNGDGQLVLAEQRRTEFRCGFVLHRFADVLVEVGGNPGGRVPEPFGDDFQRNALLEHQRRCCVARVVQSDPAHAGVDPEVFLPAKGESSDEALGYFRRCEVRCQCLEAVLDLGQRARGVWGGTSGRDRLLARRRGLGADELLAALDRR